MTRQPDPILTLVPGVNLHRHRRDGIGVAEVIAECASLLEGGVAIGWSSAAVELGVITGGQVQDEESNSLATSQWFEATVFTTDHELRWIRRPTGGVGVLVTESTIELDGWTTLESRVATRVDGVTALLWGRAAEPIGGGPSSSVWCRLSSARTGTRSVPLTGVAAGDSVLVSSSEYLAVGPHGNAVVIDERRHGLVAQSALEEAQDG